jgi:hypothetical protein
MTKSYVGRMFGTYTIYSRAGAFEGGFPWLKKSWMAKKGPLQGGFPVMVGS